MKAIYSFAFLGLFALGLTMTTANESYAQRSNFSIRFGIGSGGHGHYGSRGGYNLGVRYGSGFGYGRGGYGGYPRPGYGCGVGRPIIVQPVRPRWSPGCGVHPRGRVIVPHRGHVHVYPY